MKLRIKCSNCNREHIVTKPDDMNFSLVCEINCLSCGEIIHYKIAINKQTKEDDNALDMLMNMFGMKK